MPDGETDVRGQTDAEPLYTVAQAAALLAVSERTVRRRIASGEVAAVKVGGQYRVPSSALGVHVPDTVPVMPAGQSRSAPDTVPAPPATPVRVPDMAPLVAVIERQAEEIARLNRELGTAHEQLRQLGSGQRAPVASPFAPGEAQPANVAPATSASPQAPWWRRLLGLDR
ncbi:MAG: excisionase family DNA-binding protein [Chloroflexota bacterium]|nr:excisionase family DNA-binding protein [Chloroflexota bacterium]